MHQGASSWGYTQKEALKNLQDAVDSLIESLLEHGEENLLESIVRQEKERSSERCSTHLGQRCSFNRCNGLIGNRNLATTLTLPHTIITGAGASENVGEQAKRLGTTHALIVTDPGIAKIGYADKIAQNLHHAGIASSCFSDVTPDPTLQNVQAGLKHYTAEACDVIVSVGGGSAIDCGKGIAMKLANAGDFADYMGVDKIPNPGATAHRDTDNRRYRK